MCVVSRSLVRGAGAVSSATVQSNRDSPIPLKPSETAPVSGRLTEHRSLSERLRSDPCSGWRAPPPRTALPDRPRPAGRRLHGALCSPTVRFENPRRALAVVNPRLARRRQCPWRRAAAARAGRRPPSSGIRGPASLREGRPASRETADVANDARRDRPTVPDLSVRCEVVAVPAHVHGAPLAGTRCGARARPIRCAGATWHART